MAKERRLYIEINVTQIKIRFFNKHYNIIINFFLIIDFIVTLKAFIHNSKTKLVVYNHQIIDIQFRLSHNFTESNFEKLIFHKLLNRKSKIFCKLYLQIMETLSNNFPRYKFVSNNNFFTKPITPHIIYNFPNYEVLVYDKPNYTNIG